MIAFWNNQTFDWNIKFSFDEKTNVLRKSNMKLDFAHEQATLTVELGKRNALGTLTIKRGIAAAISALKGMGVRAIKADASELVALMGPTAIGALTLGAKQTLHKPISFRHNKAENNDSAPSLFIECEASLKNSTTIAEADILAQSVLLARDLVNTPANLLTPKILAERIAQDCAPHGISCQIFEEDFMRQHNMGAFLAVGTSSGNRPRMIVLRYMGAPNSKEVTAIIGKALTFDTGGYNLKPSSGMATMKCDMAGGASAFGTILALARNKVAANVVVVIPAAENRISRESFLPGDVLTTMAGLTVEIISTDAEGRLCMSDCMTYAIRHEGATKLIDVATLTGSAVAALGKKTTATMTNDDTFYGQFLEAAKRSGEQYWQMPSFDEYYIMIEGQIADIKNAPESNSGVMAAGLFMEHFTEGLPWIHLDIAGTAFDTKPGYEFNQAGGTGASIETLYSLFATPSA